MKKIAFLLIGVIVLTFVGCSKASQEPYLNLIYNGNTHTTVLEQYKDNNTEKSYEGVTGEQYIKIKKHEDLQYKASRSIDRCTLVIKNADTKEKIEEVVLDTNNVETDIPQGKYTYTFLVEWKNGSAKFVKTVEIE